MISPKLLSNAQPQSAALGIKANERLEGSLWTSWNEVLNKIQPSTCLCLHLPIYCHGSSMLPSSSFPPTIPNPRNMTLGPNGHTQGVREACKAKWRTVPACGGTVTGTLGRCTENPKPQAISTFQSHKTWVEKHCPGVLLTHTESRKRLSFLWHSHSTSKNSV